MIIKERDGYVCQLCNIKLDLKRRIKNEPQKNWAVIHHIDYNKKNCLEENLITLCNFCNFSVNKNRNEWTNFFKKKLNEKSVFGE